jgi:hypothetical protein
MRKAVKQIKKIGLTLKEKKAILRNIFWTELLAKKR